jgi:hypothetical protein
METGHRTAGSARACAWLVLVLAASLGLTGCGSDDRSASSDACLAQAVEAAATWPATGTPILDTVDRCKDLSTADKTHLRAVLAAFIVRMAPTPVEAGSPTVYPCLEEVGDIGCTTG